MYTNYYIEMQTALATASILGPLQDAEKSKAREHKEREDKEQEARKKAARETEEAETRRRKAARDDAVCFFGAYLCVKKFCL